MTDERYGYHQYGRHEYEPPDRPDEQGHPEDKLTPREAFGAGIALQPSSVDGDPGAGDGTEEGTVPWDLAVDSSGDLASTAGWSELGKDVAFRTAVESSDMIGTMNTANDRAELETEIERITNQDSRLFATRAEVLSRSRSAAERGRGDPNPSVVEVLLDTQVEPNLHGRYIIPITRR